MNYSNVLVAFFALIPILSFSQWHPSAAFNTPVCTALGNQEDARIVSDDLSGAIIGWVDSRNGSTNTDIYAQRIDSSGYTKWTSNGIVICNNTGNQTAVAMDKIGKGASVFTWNDWRSGNKDIYVQKVDSSGNIQWIANGVGICIKNGPQADPKIINDGNGGAIVVWQDSSAGNWDIYAQRINSSGSIQWTSGGVAICTAANSQINPRIETDGNGGAIITWQDKRNGLEYDIYAQRIDANGNTQWTANGIVICNSPDAQTNPKIESDNASGAYIAWQDKRNGNDYNVYAQRISWGGTDMWTTNGVAICSAIGNQSAIDITSDNVNGIILTWKDERSGIYQVYANTVNQAGLNKWSTDGISVANGINPNIVGDGTGGAIITWQDSTVVLGSWNVYAQKLNSSGSKVWTNNVDVGTATGGQTSPKNVSDGKGGAIFTWQDKRVTANLDIYAHRLNSNGLVPVGILEYINSKNEINSTCFPNPAAEFINIQLNANINEWNLQVVNFLGEIILEKGITNNNQTSINVSHLANGNYFYSIYSNNKKISNGSFIVIQNR